MKKTIAAFSLMCAATVSAYAFPFLLNLEILNCKPGAYTVHAYPFEYGQKQCGNQTIRWEITPRLRYEILQNGVIQIVNPPSGVYTIAAFAENPVCAGFVNLVVN